ncbi:hypothetical protein HK104_005355, partial [Borealophlyctis nickersoniae]
MSTQSWFFKEADAIRRNPTLTSNEKIMRLQQLYKYAHQERMLSTEDWLKEADAIRTDPNFTSNEKTILMLQIYKYAHEAQMMAATGDPKPAPWKFN